MFPSPKTSRVPPSRPEARLRGLCAKNVQRPLFCTPLRLDTLAQNVYNDLVGYTGLSRFARALLFCEIYSQLLAFPAPLKRRVAFETLRRLYGYMNLVCAAVAPPSTPGRSEARLRACLVRLPVRAAKQANQHSRTSFARRLFCLRQKGRTGLGKHQLGSNAKGRECTPWTGS